MEADHGRLKARLRPMRGLKRLAAAGTIAAGHAFVKNLRRGHYAITTDLDPASSCPSRVRRARTHPLTGPASDRESCQVADSTTQPSLGEY
jgi:DDE domain